MLATPERCALAVWAEMPAALRRPRPSAWARLNLADREIGCFLEGPAFDGAGNLYLVDIPFGRILRVDPQGSWSVAAEYDGWPNGLKVMPTGELLVADHKHGLLRVEPSSGRCRAMLTEAGGRPFIGLNDLFCAPGGDIYLTDQGQSGLHDPSGRVIRVGLDGRVATVLDACPSPNGLVLDAERGWLLVAMTRANAVWRVPLVDGRPTKVGLAIQLSGGIGPDGLALDGNGCLLAVHAPIGLWQFDRDNLPRRFFAAPEGAPGGAYVTNLALRRTAQGPRAFVTDAIAGRILVADLPDDS